jgi:hypothetical protein
MLVAIMLAVPAAADADLQIAFDLFEATMSYTPSAGGGTATITETADSRLDLTLRQGFTKTDSARISGGDDFNFNLTLNLSDLPGANNWSATGTLNFTDVNASDVVVATFTSTDVFTSEVSTGARYNLTIKGYIQGNPVGDSILAGGSPWVFTGESNVPGAGNQDGDANNKTITVNNPDSWGNGTLITFMFDIPAVDLDSLFNNWSDPLYGGQIQGSVIPVPAALLLGLVGLGSLGVLMRRYA